MLYGYVKFGSVKVPIVDLAHLTGNIGQHPANAVLSVVAQNYDNEQLYDAGYTVAQGHSPIYTPPETPPPARTFCYMNGGRTGAGDNSEMVVTIRTTGDDPGNLTYYVNCQVNRQEGESAILLDQSSENMLVASQTARTSREEWVNVRLFAVKYNYPDQVDPKLQRYGYFIGIVTQTHATYAGGNEAYNYNRANNGWWLPIPYINNRGYDLEYEEIAPEPEDPFDPTEPGPYDPSGDDSSDLIDLPDDPDIGVTKAGFINVYNPGINSLQGLGDILFPNVSTATDIVDAVLKLCMVLSNQNLINYVIDCHVIPCAPYVGSNAEIKVGYVMTGISVPKVTSDYVDVTCGSINIAEFFGGFLDYGNYTRVKLYLPFIGFVDTRPEFFQGGTLSVDYKFNVIDGSFMAYVRSTSSKSNLAGSVIAQYSGNACMHFPLTGANYSSMVSGIVGSAITAASAGSSSAVLGAAYSAANTAAAGPNVQQSNGYNSTSAILGIRTPYLMIERPSTAYPANYKHNKGYPTNITTTLSNVSGYTEIEDIDLSGIPLTQAEIEELRGLLKEGVYF